MLSDSIKLERFLLQEFATSDKVFNFKEINEKASEDGLTSNIRMLKKILNYLDITNVVDIHKFGNYKIKINLNDSVSDSKEIIDQRFVLSEFILEFLYKRSQEIKDDQSKEYKVILFSVQELKDAFEKELNIFSSKTNVKQIEDALYYLKLIESIKIEGGFLVVYNRISISRLAKGYVYTKKDYEKLDSFYKNKVQQIHIVG